MNASFLWQYCGCQNLNFMCYLLLQSEWQHPLALKRKWINLHPLRCKYVAKQMHHKGVCTTRYTVIHARFCPVPWFLFSTAQYGEKLQNALLFWLHFIIEFQIFTQVCVFLSFDCSLLLLYILNKQFLDILLCFPCKTIGSGNQHGGRKCDNLQN